MTSNAEVKENRMLKGLTSVGNEQTGEMERKKDGKFKLYTHPRLIITFLLNLAKCFIAFSYKFSALFFKCYPACFFLSFEVKSTWLIKIF